MGMIGSALSAVGAIFGGVQATKAMNKVRKGIMDDRKRNQDWYDRRINESATQRADAMQLINMTEDSIRRRNEAAQGRAAVMGGTDDALAATKDANNQALAQTMGHISAGADARKDAIEQQYQQTDRAYSQQLQQIEANKAAAIGEAVKGVAGAASQMDFGSVKIGKKGKMLDL